MKILFYGRLADVLGREMDVAVDGGCTIAELRNRVADSEPAAAGPLRDKRVRACVGDTIVSDEHVLDPDEPVEFFPPVSGG